MDDLTCSRCRTLAFTMKAVENEILAQTDADDVIAALAGTEHAVNLVADITRHMWTDHVDQRAAWLHKPVTSARMHGIATGKAMP